MSTVVLTPTHIGSDHNVIYHCYPHESIVDLDYKKIFIDPKKMFLVGTVGQFDPEMIDTPTTWNMLRMVLTQALGDLGTFGLHKDMTNVQDEKIVGEYISRFDYSGHTFIVTRNYRFVIYYTKLSSQLILKRIGDYAGIGSGGLLAAGMAMGMPSLKEVFKNLRNLDHLSSSENTIIPLSILKSDKVLTKKIMDGRKAVRELGMNS